MTMKLKSPISVLKKDAFECLIIHIYVVWQSRCYTKPDNEILLHNTIDEFINSQYKVGANDL